MAEYIKLEVAVKAFNNFDAGRADSPPFTLLTPEEFAEYLYELPSADVAPVRHGRWNADETCSLCGEKSTEGLDATKWDYWLPNYCPNCGAKMDGGTDDES